MDPTDRSRPETLQDGALAWRRKYAEMRRLLGLVLVLALVLGFRSSAGAEGRTVVRFGSDLVIEEEMVFRDAVVVGGNVTVNGVVEHDVVAVGGSIILGPESVVGHNVVSVGGTIEKAEGAEVQGDSVEVNLPVLASSLSSIFRENWQGLRWAFQILALVAFVGFLALALLLITLLPRPVGLIAAAIEDHTLKAALWGLLGTVLIVPLAIFLAISVVGLLFMPLYGFSVACSFLVGYIAVAQLVGKKITTALKRPDQPMIWQTFWGLIILWAIGWVPVLGWLVNGVAALFGLGGVIICLLTALRA
jgi:hypothetical protein